MSKTRKCGDLGDHKPYDTIFLGLYINRDVIIKRRAESQSGLTLNSLKWSLLMSHTNVDIACVCSK